MYGLNNLRHDGMNSLTHWWIELMNNFWFCCLQKYVVPTSVICVVQFWYYCHCHGYIQSHIITSDNLSLSALFMCDHILARIIVAYHHQLYLTTSHYHYWSGMITYCHSYHMCSLFISTCDYMLFSPVIMCNILLRPVRMCDCLSSSLVIISIITTDPLLSPVIIIMQ